MSKTCKDCLHCSVDGDEVLCSGMPWHYPFGGSDTVTLDKQACEHFLERKKPTVFDYITQSEEELAKKLVYPSENFKVREWDAEKEEWTEPHGFWRSTLIPNHDFDTKLEALAATIEELKKEYTNGI